MKRIINLIKDRLYFRKHPETALRYLPIVFLLKKNGWLNSEILEIGSGSYGIAPYLNRQITGLDTDFSEPKYDLLKQVRGVGEKIPFKPNSFDVCILSDVLEHVPKGKRNPLLREAVRVARMGVIVSGPFGPHAFEQDKELSLLSDHHFLKEHLKFGLPEESDIYSFLDPKVSIIEKSGSYLNLQVRRFIMGFFVSKSKLLYYIYLKGLMPFIPIFKLLNWPPQYRSVFLIRLNHESRN